MAERHGRILGRLSELGLALAEQAQEQAPAAMEGDDPKAVAELSLTFHRISPGGEALCRRPPQRELAEPRCSRYIGLRVFLGG